MGMSNNTATDLTVANIIKDQIGPKAFFMMGAANLLGDESSLTFKVGRNPRSVSHVRVTLDADDTYTVEFLRCTTSHKTYQTTRKVLQSDSLVYAEDLHRVIHSGTGLFLSL